MKIYFRLQALAVGMVLTLLLAVSSVSAQSTSNDNFDSDQPNYLHAQHGFGRHHRHGGGHIRALAEKLGLNETQKTQLEQLHANHRENIEPLLTQIRSKEQEIHQSMAQGSFNEALVTQQLTEIAGLKAKLMGEHFRLKQEMLTILTPEQKEKLQQLREEFRQKRRGGWRS
ncbi:MAG: Spy/CpxP family protein refolding chaperone [Acidobacteriota bacterium]